MKFKKNINCLLVMLTGSFAIFNCFAGGTQQFIEDTPIEVSKPFEIKNWTKKDIIYDVPAFGIEHQVQLEFEICAPYKKYKAGSGSNPVLQISVNGNSLTAKQLLNRPNSFKYMGTTEITWIKGNKLRVLYAQNFEMVPKYIKQYPKTKNPYRFVFDISKFSKSGQKNKIVFNYSHSYKDITLKARNINVVITKKFIHPKASVKVIPAPIGAILVKAIRGKIKEPVKVFLTNSGAIVVAMNKQKYTFLTKTTIPNGGWKITTMSVNGKNITQGSTGSVGWETPFYTVKRHITVKVDHIVIRDTITNTSSKLIGIWLENWIEHNDRATKYLLGGRKIIGNARFEESENPTACLQLKNSAIGILPESDIFQAHLSLFKKDNRIGLIDHNLGIESGKSVTMKWSIYPVAKGGYWDMVNAIRRNWGVNFTIPGPFAFRSLARLKRTNSAEYIDWIKARNLKMVCDSIPVYNTSEVVKFSKKYGDKGRYTKYAHGSASLLGTDFLKNVESVRDTLKKILPEVEYFFYFHAQVSTREDGAELYNDSIIYSKNGTPLCYSTKFLKMYIPTMTNKYGKALWSYVELVVDKMDMNMYWDEMCYSMKRMVYGVPWDGCTVELDSKFNVSKKITCVPLAMQPLKLKIIDYVRSKGKILLGNSQAVTPTMRKQQVLRFVEAGSYDNIYKTNVGCIIGLSTHHPEKSPEDSYDQVYNFLKRGALYYSNWSIPVGTVPNDYFIHYMFPTTPVEIFAGTIFAKERIITSNSGIYSLPGKVQAVKIVVISPQGLIINHNKLVKEVKGTTGYSYEVRIPSNYIVILIKKLLK